MNEFRTLVIKKTALVAIGEAVSLAILFTVYALLGKLHISVLLGGVTGLLVAAGNFFALAVIATLAADKAEAGDPASGQKLIRGSYPIRMLVMAGVLILCATSGVFDVIALVLPLLFVRPILTIAEFFRKKGE